MWACAFGDRVALRGLGQSWSRPADFEGCDVQKRGAARSRHRQQGGVMSTADTAAEIRSFQIEVPEEQIDNLRRRIAATRWPTKELVSDRSQRVQLATLQALARYWTNGYDGRKCEARLNALP